MVDYEVSSAAAAYPALASLCAFGHSAGHNTASPAPHLLPHAASAAADSHLLVSVTAWHSQAAHAPFPSSQPQPRLATADAGASLPPPLPPAATAETEALPGQPGVGSPAAPATDAAVGSTGSGGGAGSAAAPPPELRSVQRQLAAVELRLLESKLRLLDSQRRLRAVQCERFVAMMEASLEGEHGNDDDMAIDDDGPAAFLSKPTLGSLGRVSFSGAFDRSCLSASSSSNTFPSAKNLTSSSCSSAGAASGTSFPLHSPLPASLTLPPITPCRRSSLDAPRPSPSFPLSSPQWQEDLRYYASTAAPPAGRSPSLSRSPSTRNHWAAARGSPHEGRLWDATSRPARHRPVPLEPHCGRKPSQSPQADGAPGGDWLAGALALPPAPLNWPAQHPAESGGQHPAESGGQLPAESGGQLPGAPGDAAAGRQPRWAARWRWRGRRSATCDRQLHGGPAGGGRREAQLGMAELTGLGAAGRAQTVDSREACGEPSCSDC